MKDDKNVTGLVGTAVDFSCVYVLVSVYRYSEEAE